MIQTIKSYLPNLRPKPRIYTSCSTLPLDLFRECLKGDLKALVMPGSTKPNQEELADVWDGIFLEYIDLVRNPEQMYMLTLMREIAVLESELKLSAALVVFLSMTYNKDAEASLRKMGYKFTLKRDDRKHNTGQMEKVIRQRKSRLLSLDKKRKLLEQHQDKVQKGPKENPGDFDKVLAELSAFQGYRLDASTITVAEYAAIHNRFKKHVENSKKSKTWKK